MKCKFIEKSLIFMLMFMPLAPAKAQEWIQNLRNPNMPFILQYSGQSLSASKADNYSDEIDMEKTSAKIVAPLTRSPEFKQSLSFDFHQTQIEQINAVPGNPVPDQLTEIKFGHQFIMKKEEGRHYGMNTQIGSASDEPFHNWSVTSVELTPFYFYDQTSASSWMFLINYSNQRSFLPHIPLPGVMYIYNNQAGMTLFGGIPVFGITYSFTPKVMVSYFTLLPWMHHLKFTYFIDGPSLQLYTEYKIAPEMYKPINYVENEDRVILEDHKAILGIKFPLTEGLSMDVHGGYSLNRKIYQAERPGAHKDWQEHIQDQAFFNAQLGIRL